MIKTKILYLLTTASLLVVSSQARGLFSGKRAIYAKIDEWLEKNVPTDDPETNLIQATRHFCLAKGSMSPSVRALWGQFVELEEIDTTNRCNENTVDILSRNAIAANLIRQLDGDYEKRTKNIVSWYVKKHAGECQAVDSENFETRLKSMDSKALEVVKELTDYYLNSPLVGKPTNNGSVKVWLGFSHFKTYNKLLSINAVATLADYVEKTRAAADKRALLRSVQKFKDDKAVLLSIGQMIEELIEEPYKRCKYYVDNLGDLFTVANFDAESKNYPTYGTQSFLDGWQKFEICRNVVHQPLDETSGAILKLLAERRD